MSEKSAHTPVVDDQQEQPVMLRVADVARLLTVSRSAVYRLIADGTIPSVRIGHCRRVTPRQLAEYVQSLELG